MDFTEAATVPEAVMAFPTIFWTKSRLRIRGAGGVVGGSGDGVRFGSAITGCHGSLLFRGREGFRICGGVWGGYSAGGVLSTGVDDIE